MIKKSGYKIVASLKHGAIFNKGLLYMLYYCVGVSILLIPFMIAIYCEEMSNIVSAIIIAILPWAMTILCCLYFIRYIKNLYKAVDKCLIDGVLLDADSFTIDICYDLVIFVPLKKRKISVEFKYNGKKFVRNSGSGKYSKLVFLAYSTIFNKYADRKIKILYSESQDTVLILKD